MSFDEARLDDPAVLSTADLRLRGLAEAGARVRRQAQAASDLRSTGLDRLAGRPRAIVLIGSGAELIDTALVSTSPVPTVRWQGATLPGWVGSLDLVVVLAAEGGDGAVALLAAEASRRGSRVLVAAPEASIVADHIGGADTALLPAVSPDPFAIAVAVLDLLGGLGIGVSPEVTEIADALDAVAVECSPLREFSLNPAKLWAIALSDTVPVLWGGSDWAADAASRTAQALRRATGRPALAGSAEDLLPVVEAARVASIFDDPIEGGHAARPSLLVLDDGSEMAGQAAVALGRRTLIGAADARNVRVEVISADDGAALARYARLIQSGRYAAEYLRLGATD